MQCKKCKKEIPDGSLYCNHCGKKQVTTKRKAHKRAHGTGTIRKDMRYANPYIALAPSTTSGKGRTYIGCYESAAKAQAAIDKYCTEVRPELYNIKLEKLYEMWSKNHFESLTESGKQGYRAAFKSIDTLHSRKMRELKTADFQTCIDKCVEKGASRSKCEKVRQLCSQLCKCAMQNDIMDKNYAEFLKLPKEEKKEKNIFTDSELKTLWEHTDDKRVQIILFMIYTGFRIGEIVKIQKSDVHIEEGYIIGGSKTEAGKNRIVPLPPMPEIKEFIAQWLKESNNDFLIGGTANNFREYSFYPALCELNMIDPPVYNNKSRKKEFKNPRLTPHCTRHTFATLSVNAGFSPENLQKIIGHANFETTADIYVHQDLDALKSDMVKLKKFNSD